MIQKILIVEDEAISAEGLESALRRLKYEVVGIAANALDALDLVAQHKPDLAFLDINIQGQKNGIWLAKQMNLQGIPFVFLTAYGDKGTIKEAVDTSPLAYLIKPFTRGDIIAAIEMGAKEMEKRSIELQEINKGDGYIFVKDEHQFIKIVFNEIQYIKSNGNYLEFYFYGKKQLIRMSMKQILLDLPKNQFIQTHRSFIVNYPLINRVKNNNAIIGDAEIPIGASYKTDVLKMLNIK